MDQVIQDNASSSEQIAAMSEDLRKKSNELADLVSFFRIDQSVDSVKIERKYEKRAIAEKQAPAVALPKSSEVLEPSYTAQDDDEDDFTEF